MSGSNNAGDIRVIAALLDPVNVEIINFLKTSGPFKIGQIKSKLEGVHLTKQGFTKRLEKLEDLGFVVRLEKRRNRKTRKKYQHTTWQPFNPSFYERLLQQRSLIIHIAEETKNLTTVSVEIPEAFDKAAELHLSRDDSDKAARLMKELRARVSVLLDRFDVLNDTMRKRTLEWAVQAKYFENLAYT